MEISFSQSFLADIERIDKVVMIDRCVIERTDYKPEIICHEGKVQACIIGAEGNCDRLDFYYGEELAFTIIGDIVMNQNRTIFEFNLPSTSKATISCPWLTEDTKVLEGVGPDLGSSFYKDITVSSSSLVWKESLGKYIVDRGIQDNHSFDIELLDTKSGQLEERPIRFKSYQGITIEPGNWEVEMIKVTNLVKHDVYSEISSSSFLVWDSPMIDAKVNLEVEPECIDNFGKYLDPGKVVFGNSDCYQFINYQSSLKGFKVWGTEDSSIYFMFNREYTGGPYESFECKIGEDGVAEVKIPELQFYHFNGILTGGPSRITKVETIIELEEPVDSYIPNPDKTYVAKLNNEDATVKIEGYSDYIEYEKYLGEIKEIGRGTEHINSIPELNIKVIESGGLISQVDSLGKQILVGYNSSVNADTNYCIYQLEIRNNIEVEKNIVTTSSLVSDYKIKIEQSGIIWKIENSPEYVNGEDGINIYTLDYENGSSRVLKVLTNYSLSGSSISAVMDPASSAIFRVEQRSTGREVIDGEWWNYINISITTKSENEDIEWRPQDENKEPLLVRLKYGSINTGISFYAIQLRKIEPRMEIWEEITPGRYAKTGNTLNIYNTLVKNFIVVEKVSGAPQESMNWYYYDLTGFNKFYLTDYNYQSSTSGIVYFVSEDTTVLNLGTGELREKYSRVINVNRSDLIGSLGVLTITDSPEYPGSWRNVIDNNTVGTEVIRELNNIYIQVGEGQVGIKDEDLTIDVNSINLYKFYVKSNFKYIIQAYGYLELFDSSTVSPNYPQEIQVLSGYNEVKEVGMVLTRLDEEQSIEESYIEIRSGNLVRKITLQVNGPLKEHDYLLSIGSQEIQKPNLIRIFNNGSLTPNSTRFIYKTTTTPKFEYSGINKFSDTTYPVFTLGNGYRYHTSTIPFTITNARALSYSKYPLKSFGSIKESSLSYSETEETVPLDYPLYMKGKEHYIWCVENLTGLSDINDPETTGGVIRSRTDMVLDAKGSSGETIYIVSRYSVNNRTFIIETPEETEFNIKRNDLEATIKIQSQQNIGLDEKSQIEYAIPIQISCNVENNGGNIFLGSLDYKAETKITDDSVKDVIEVENDIINLEGINGSYIKNYITSDKIQYLSIMIFQLGTNRDIFQLYSSIPDLWIDSTTNYVIPEIGSDYTITSFSATLNTESGGGDNVCTLTSSYDSKYFLIRVDSRDRVTTGNNWYDANNLPNGLIKNTTHSINIQVGIEGGTTKTFNPSFTKYGCNYGLYVEGSVGFGNIKEDYSNSINAKNIQVSSDGGSILIHAGIFNAVNGIDSTEALIVPEKYEFIGENQPLEFSWNNGNLDDSGNLRIVLPPRTREEDGDKKYILKVTQPNEYYPINLYIVFYQPSLRGSSPDTGKNNYKLMFLKDKINIMSDGSVVDGNDTLYFTSNLTEEDFNDVTFEWKTKHHSLNISVLEEIGRSYKEGYVKFKFNPNSDRNFIDAYIYAKYNGYYIGKISARQGYFCLTTKYYNPAFVANSWVSNYSPYEIALSRVAPESGHYLYSYEQGHNIIANNKSETPCKSNNDNANTSTSVFGRGVYSLSSYKKEYYDESEQELKVDEIFKETKIDYISSAQILNSYGLSYVPISDISYEEGIPDHDAKVNPRFFSEHGISREYITDTNFSEYCPYLELSYDVKDEFVREDKIIVASGRITLKHPDTDDLVDFYILITNICGKSDEPEDVETLEFSGYDLKFDCNGGVKQISYNPASFRDVMTLSMVGDSSWVAINLLSDTNYMTFNVADNITVDEDPAFYRTVQAKIDVEDPRNNYVLKSFYFNLEQEPDIQHTTGGSDVPTPITGVPIFITLKNDRANDITLSGQIQFGVRGSGLGWISANLPGTNPDSNNFTVLANSSSIKYSVISAGFNESIDPEDYLGGNIEIYSVIKYDPDSGGSSTTALSPYTLTRDDGGSLSYEKNKSYTVTFS